MANIKHFADTAAGTLEFKAVDYRKDGAYGFDAATNSWVKTTRKVEYKAFASKHVCDDRCINATGRIMKCECSCGGKNHGKGAFNCSSEAA
jgi:hypothetical protein